MEDFSNDKKLEHVKVLLAQSNYEQVVKQGKHYLHLFPENAQLRAMISVSFQNLGNLSDALKFSEQAVAMDPVDPYCLYIHAKALFLSARSDEAIGFIEKAIEINPIHASYLGLKAGYLLEKGKVSEAYQLVKDGLSIDPENSNCNNFKIICEQLLNEKENSIASADTPYTKLDSSGFFTKGYNAYLKGDPEQAIKFIGESLKLNPHNVHAKKLLVESYKMRFPLYRKFILNHIDIKLKNNKTPSMLVSLLITIALTVYVLLVMVDLLIVRTPLDRFYLFTSPFIAFSVFIIGSWMIYPLSDLLIIHRKELREILDRSKLKRTLWALSALMAALVFCILGILLKTDAYFIFAVCIVLLSFMSSGNLINSVSGRILQACLIAITIIFCFQIVEFKIVLFVFLILFYVFLIINVKPVKEV